ncbi:hypothetical protein [Xenorhabdus taiwanensis]|uniref:Uncharacterized protein n=1 Tax=Xenorhabdus taiwanensis TaxID=3085177 RepID=A0ABM8JR17_9GAMM|nr:hypothetical protein TCT1_00700 [Xenorhabdus sp. TCT-1]
MKFSEVASSVTCRILTISEDTLDYANSLMDLIKSAGLHVLEDYGNGSVARKNIFTHAHGIVSINYEMKSLHYLDKNQLFFFALFANI